VLESPPVRRLKTTKAAIKTPGDQVNAMHIKTVGNTIVAAGVLILIASALADSMGFGGSPDFGPGQITGLIFGHVIADIGLNVRSQAD